MRVPGRSPGPRADDTLPVDDARALLDRIDEAILVVDPRDRIMALNEPARRLFRVTADERFGTLDQLIPHHPASGRADVLCRRSDGFDFPAEVNLAEFRLPTVGPVRLAVVHDLTEQRRLVAANDSLSELLAGVLETTHTDVAVLDEHLMVVAANSPFRREFLDGRDPTGMSFAELTGLVDDVAMIDVLDVVRQAARDRCEVQVFAGAGVLGEHWLDVTATPLPTGPGVAVRIRDAAELVAAARVHRVDRAQDDLTGLLSRDGMQELLTGAFRGATAEPLCIAFLDIDQFTVIRQTLGYGAGDELVRQVAANLRRCVPEHGRIARMVGDTFCIAFHPMSSLDVDRISAELRDAVRQPVNVLGRTVRITASVGCVVVGPDEPVEAAMQHAELAMQEAGRRGGNRSVNYTPELGEPQEGMVRLWNALRSALQFRQMEVWFQPIVSLQTGRPVGAEALCRWHHPQYGDVSPGEFIPIAERNSEILNIGSFVHGRSAETMNFLRSSRTHRVGDFQISFNASPNELAWPQFATNLLARIRANDARPEWFALDITEAALQQRDEAVMDNIRRLAEAGLTLSLDDFGAGYSSLERLRGFPVSRVKIDRRFVAGMLENERHERLVTAIIELADELGMDTIAEGVETLEQAARLHELGCHAAQGFLFAPAVPEGELLAVLRDLSAGAATPRWRASAHSA